MTKSRIVAVIAIVAGIILTCALVGVIFLIRILIDIYISHN